MNQKQSTERSLWPNRASPFTKRENQNACLSMILTFLVSLAIMVCFAMSLLAIGVIAAGLSSIFPNLFSTVVGCFYRIKFLIPPDGRNQ